MTNYTTSTPLISDPDLAYGILVVGVDNTGRLLDPLSLLAELDPVFSASPAAGITTQKITNWDTAYGWGNHATAGYLTTFTELDPVFGASPAAGITTQKITNWDTAYGWGNHATAGYETTTQLNARDTANRNRANHTGTQLAATISDIGTTISANTDVAANTAARHAAVTVTDSSEIDFTLTGQNITASLINGSIGETRLSSGVNTSLGLANTALQPNQANDGQIVNGVAHFVRNTTPTVRVDGSALVVGDRWYNPNTGILGFWNGTFWLSSQLYSSEWSNIGTSLSTTTQNVSGSIRTGGSVFFTNIVVQGAASNPPHDQTNYWQFLVECYTTLSGITLLNLNSHQITGITTETWVSTTAVNTAYTNPRLINFHANKFGTAGFLRRFCINVYYRQIL